MRFARLPFNLVLSLILSFATTVSAIGQQPASTQPDSAPNVTLLSAGASPRNTLRIAPRTINKVTQPQLGDVRQHQAYQDLVGVKSDAQECGDGRPRHTP